MSSESIRSQISALEKRGADYLRQQVRHQDNANRAAQSANAKADQARRSRSESTRNSYLRAAEREAKKHGDESGKVADLARKIADINKQIAGKQKALESALKQESGKKEREAKSRQRQQDREADTRRRKERDHAREVARLSRPEIRHVIVQPPKPEILRVLYLTASPDMSAPLRVDAEVNNVLREIRGAKFRDQIALSVIPAATTKDLVNGINDHRPHVVHFSGHGNAGLLAFDNASLERPDSETMEFDILAELLDATDQPPKLLVMNACNTLEGSDVLLEAVPVLIAMSDSVGDAGAGVFASQFYAAIASAQSIGAALRQAKAMMKQALLRDDAELPQIRHRPDTDPSGLVLIQLPQTVL